MDLKSKRVLSSSNAATTEMTDELYEELSIGQQFLAKIIEAMGLSVQIAAFTNSDGEVTSHYVHRSSIEEADATLFAIEAEAKAEAEPKVKA